MTAAHGYNVPLSEECPSGQRERAVNRASSWGENPVPRVGSRRSAGGAGLRPAGARRRPGSGSQEEGGSWGKHGFPHVTKGAGCKPAGSAYGAIPEKCDAFFGEGGLASRSLGGGQTPRLQSSSPGGVPERPKGAGCKPAGSAYGGSNPPSSTSRFSDRGQSAGGAGLRPAEPDGGRGRRARKKGARRGNTVSPTSQRERAVNPPAQPTEVRILPPPLRAREARSRARVESASARRRSSVVRAADS